MGRWRHLSYPKIVKIIRDESPQYNEKSVKNAEVIDVHGRGEELVCCDGAARSAVRRRIRFGD